jgi:hypothetical protein
MRGLASRARPPKAAIAAASIVAGWIVAAPTVHFSMPGKLSAFMAQG